MGDPILFGRVQNAEQTPFDNDTNGFTAEDVQAAIEEVKDTAPGNQARMGLAFGYKGNVSDKFLQRFSGVPSDESPFIMAENGTIRAISVAVKTTTTCTFEIFINAVSVETITITAGKKERKVGLDISLSFLDEISVKQTSGASVNPGLTTFVQVTL